jgi:hypothetical protein
MSIDTVNLHTYYSFVVIDNNGKVFIDIEAVHLFLILLLIKENTGTSLHQYTILQLIKNESNINKSPTEINKYCYDLLKELSDFDEKMIPGLRKNDTRMD